MCLTCTVHLMHNPPMRLSQYLAEQKQTPTAFARQLGVAHTTVMRWASGDVSPTMEWMEQIAQETGGAVMPNDFMRDAPSSEAA